MVVRITSPNRTTTMPTPPQAVSSIKDFRQGPRVWCYERMIMRSSPVKTIEWTSKVAMMREFELKLRKVAMLRLPLNWWYEKCHATDLLKIKIVISLSYFERPTFSFPLEYRKWGRPEWFIRRVLEVEFVGLKILTNSFQVSTKKS